MYCSAITPLKRFSHFSNFRVLFYNFIIQELNDHGDLPSFRSFVKTLSHPDFELVLAHNGRE